MNPKPLLGFAAGLLVLSATPAHADVSLEVAGAGGASLPQTTVAQTGPAVAKDAKNSCTGDSVAGALERATSGKWTGTYSTDFGDYSVDSILGEAHPFSSKTYWSLYVDGKPAQAGACTTKLQTGDRVQWYAACAGATTGCFSGEPVALTAPATAKPGQAFSVSVTQSDTTYDANFNGTTVITPAAGATVGGQTTGGDGRANVTLTDRGPQTVTATKTGRPPSSASVCVTDGADGFCGTTKPGQPAPTTPQPQPLPAPAQTYTGPIQGRVTSVKSGTTFAKGKGPRTLAGTVAVPPAGVKRVALRLSTQNGKTCAGYDAKRELFTRTKKCGATHAKFFSIGTAKDWSYLLPGRLGRGRYVLDVRVTDNTGKVDSTLQRGRNRVVFTVK